MGNPASGGSQGAVLDGLVNADAYLLLALDLDLDHRPIVTDGSLVRVSRCASRSAMIFGEPTDRRNTDSSRIKSSHLSSWLGSR